MARFSLVFLRAAGCCGPLVILGMLGCSSDESSAEPLSIAWVSKGKCNSFFDASAFGARLAGVELGNESEGVAQVELLEPDDCTENPAVPEGTPEECLAFGPQMAAVQEALDREFSALAISVSNAGCVSPYIDRAVDQGMTVITFDSDAPESKRHSYYGMDNRAAGRFVVARLARMLEEGGKVAIQTAMVQDEDGVYQLSRSTSYVERMAGVEEGLAEHPSLTLVDTVPCQGNDPLDPMCAAEVEALLEDHPDLAGLILSRGKVLRELDLDQHAPRFAAAVQSEALRVVGFDVPGDALDNIASGYAQLVVAQKQFAWGYDVVHLAYDSLMGELELPDFYDSGWYLVCPDNVEQYAEMLSQNDFRGELPECRVGE